LHTRLARQREDAHFLFLLLLQAKLPVVSLSRHTISPVLRHVQGTRIIRTTHHSTQLGPPEKRSLRGWPPPVPSLGGRGRPPLGPSRLRKRDPLGGRKPPARRGNR